MKKKALPFYTIVPVCRVSHEERGRVRCEGDCGFIHLPWAFDGIGAAYFLMGGVVVGRGGGGGCSVEPCPTWSDAILPPSRPPSV